MDWVRKTALCLTAVSALMAVGCSGGKDAAPEPAPEPSAKSGTAAPAGDFKVALITPGPVSDSGWSAIAYEGLKAIESELGAKVNNQEATGSKISDAMRSYAQDGYKLVFGHGFEYNQPAMDLAKDFPDTVFVSSSGGKTAKNVGAFRFYLEQGFYIAGVIAASMTNTNRLAMIGGPDVPSIRSTFKAFRAGAKSVKPDIDVLEVFTGKDSDIAAAKQATAVAIESGADFVIHQANAAASGVFEACKAQGAYCFGANSNQNDYPGAAMIGSAVIVAKPAFVELAKQVQAGKYEGGIKLVGMDVGAIDFVFNPKLLNQVPKAVQDKVEALKGQIATGKLVIAKDEF